MTATATLFCPACGSPSLEYSELAGGKAQCKVSVCNWSGSRESVLSCPIHHDFAGREELIDTFAQSLRNLYSERMGLSLLKLLIQWGFVPVAGSDKVSMETQRKTFARYIVAIGIASLRATLETRVALEAERVAKQKESYDVA